MTTATFSPTGGASLGVTSLSEEITKHDGLKKTLLPLWWERVFDRTEDQASVLDLNAMLRALLRSWRFKALDLDKGNDQALFNSIVEAIGLKLSEFQFPSGSEEEKRVTQLSHLIKELQYEYKFDKYAFSTIASLLGRLDKVIHGGDDLNFGILELDKRYKEKLEALAKGSFRENDVAKACEISRYFLGRVIEFGIAGKVMNQEEVRFLESVRSCLATIVGGADSGRDSELLVRARENIRERLVSLCPPQVTSPPHDETKIRSMP